MDGRGGQPQHRRPGHRRPVDSRERPRAVPDGARPLGSTADHETRLVDQMPYYIAPVDEDTDFLKITSPEELKVVDPACGSGHMLTYAFDSARRVSSMRRKWPMALARSPSGEPMQPAKSSGSFRPQLRRSRLRAKTAQPR